MSPSIPSFQSQPLFANPLVLAFANLLAETSPGSTGPGASQPSPQLQAFLDAIPFANDGDVITPDHHNTLRTAIGVIARSMEESQFANVVTLSFSPVLQPVLNATPWRATEGESLGPEQFASGNAEGWMPLELPNGTDIDALHVRGHVAAKPTVWVAALKRKAFDGSVSEDVIPADLTAKAATAGPFSGSFSQTPEDVSPTLASNLRRVDNSRFRYLFSTKLGSGSPQPAAVALKLVQVTCTRG
jgi:hypothetical protein